MKIPDDGPRSVDRGAEGGTGEDEGEGEDDGCEVTHWGLSILILADVLWHTVLRGFISTPLLKVFEKSDNELK